MEGYIAGILEKICSICKAVSAEVTIWTDACDGPIPVLKCGHGAEVKPGPADHRQMSLFSVSETGPGIILNLPGEWTLQKTGTDTWRLLTKKEIFDVELLLSFDGTTGGNVINLIRNASPLLDLMGTSIPFGDRTGRREIESPGKPGPDPFPEFDPPMYGSSTEIRLLKKRTCMVAASSVPVLIEGENGTGKEIIARNLHNTGPRKDKPLVIVNCMEMPETMLQGELFGHVRGAFTGAMYDRRGLVEGAAGGTFFLDEIGELPLTLQASLLRVIQEKEIRRIGESERRFIDTRFIFATNRDLAELVREGSFREDLYYRIRGVRLAIPPLRERRSDIMILARHFLSLAARKEGIMTPGISNASVRHLVAHEWPGNVRELKNEMERVIALYPGVEVVQPGMLSSSLRDSWAARGSGPMGMDRDTLPEAVRKLERRMIVRALEKFDSNRTRSAEFLGITRQGLLKKLKRYHLAEKT